MMNKDMRIFVVVALTSAFFLSACSSSSLDVPASPSLGFEAKKGDPGTGEKCIVGSSCPIGSTGPGGGVVFYDAGSQQSWGRYLEFAPTGWSGSPNDPFDLYCNSPEFEFGTSATADRLRKRWEDPELQAMLGTEIGKGVGNTNLMLAGCTYGAAYLVHAYTGGGKNDWFIPSKDELNELCKYVRGQKLGDSNVSCAFNLSDEFLPGFVANQYWSSSEAGVVLANRTSTGRAWYIRFNIGEADNTHQDNIGWVRPVRAF